VIAHGFNNSEQLVKSVTMEHAEVRGKEKRWESRDQMLVFVAG